MLHLVDVTAVLELASPTGPMTLPSVQVTAVPARTAKPAAAPNPPAA
jgi:hypothetical protein